ncbi:MAG: hypothetical protein HOH33_17650 [Verrucomicrobia bacterium]|nr:hypothetical protein [Verrucomicrobiota bacterium]
MKLSLNQTKKYRVLAFAALLLTPCMLIAHPGDGDIHSLSDGVQHFFSGWDHIFIAALAGFLIASGRKLWSVKSLCAAACVPLLVTWLHQSLLLQGSTQWMASIGLGLASLAILLFSGLASQIRPLQTYPIDHLRKIGIGFALLALALVQF